MLSVPLDSPAGSSAPLVPQPHSAAFAVLPGNEPEWGLSHHLLLYARRPGRLFRSVGAFLLRFSPPASVRFLTIGSNNSFFFFFF